MAVGDGGRGEAVGEVRGGLDACDVSGRSDAAGGEQAVVADVRTDVDERVSGAEPEMQPAGDVGFPDAEEVEVALDDVAGGHRDPGSVAGAGEGGDRVVAQVPVVPVCGGRGRRHGGAYRT
jgi:hypothetical protein